MYDKRNGRIRYMPGEVKESKEIHLFGAALLHPLLSFFIHRAFIGMVNVGFKC